MVTINLTLPIQVINFLLTYWVLSRFLLRPVITRILERQADEKKICDEITLKKKDVEVFRNEKTTQLAQFQVDSKTDFPFTPFRPPHTELPEEKCPEPELTADEQEALRKEVIRKLIDDR
jgi:hypothetical protein